MKTYIPQWARLPRSIIKEYKSGDTLEEIANRYGISTSPVRTALMLWRVKIRPPGTLTKRKKRNTSKLTDKQIERILYLDQHHPEITHIKMGKMFGVSRERIRQICKLFGHVTRRLKLEPERVQRLELISARKIAKKLAKEERIKIISSAWRKGMSLSDLAMLMYGQRKSYHTVMTRIGCFREKYGKVMFPYRMKNHWKFKTTEEQAKRVLDISRDWNEHADVDRIQRLFGYKTYNTAYSRIVAMRRKWPHLFKTKKEILDDKLMPLSQPSLPEEKSDQAESHG